VCSYLRDLLKGIPMKMENQKPTLYDGLGGLPALTKVEQGHETEGDRAMFTFSPAVSDEFTR
jgi:hypothetical protein